MFISRKIKYFMQVAESLSFKNAAEKLFLTTTPVSKGVHDLENFLGYRLFYRVNSGIALTKKGRILYEKLTPIIDKLEEIENMSKNTMHESITIGVDGFYFYGLNRIIQNICKKTTKTVNSINNYSPEVVDKFLNDDIAMLVINALTPDENIPGECYFDLGSDVIKIIISSEIYREISDVTELMKTVPLIQLNSTISHPYFQKVHKYRSQHNINTHIFSMSEVPNVHALLSEGIGMSFVSDTVSNGEYWKNGNFTLLEPPINDLIVYRKLYIRKNEFKNFSFLEKWQET